MNRRERRDAKFGRKPASIPSADYERRAEAIDRELAQIERDLEAESSEPNADAKVDKP